MPDPTVNDMLTYADRMNQIGSENRALREQVGTDEDAVLSDRSKYECLVNAVNQLAPEKAQQIFATAASNELMQSQYDRTQAEGEALYNKQASGARLTPEEQERLNDDMGLQ